MIKEKKNVHRAKTLNNLEKDIIEKEKELNALKKAFELNDFTALNILPMKFASKTKRHSIKIPKELNNEINEKRKELKKLKEIEELDKIQMTLFKNIKSQRNKNYKLNPITQRINSTDKNKKYFQTEDVFANNLNKECEKILGNKIININNKIKLNSTMTNQWQKNNDNILKKFEKVNYRTKYINEFRKEMNDIDKIININNKIINDKKNTNKDDNIYDIDSDEEKDKEFLNNLDKNLKMFYSSKTQQIFDFLKSINLCRYIHHFLNSGVDLFEEFISLPKNFFEKMSNPFLTQKQIDKLYKKISSYKNSINEPKTKTKNELGCGTETIIKKDINIPKPKIKIDKSSNYSVNNSINLINKDELICCWNCLKPLKKENAILKENDKITNEDEDSIIFKYKYFCSDICVNIFQNENNIKNVKNNIENNFDDKEIDNNINNNINANNRNMNEEEEDSYEGDDYDPMEDF